MADSSSTSSSNAIPAIIVGAKTSTLTTSSSTAMEATTASSILIASSITTSSSSTASNTVTGEAIVIASELSIASSEEPSASGAITSPSTTVGLTTSTDKFTTTNALGGAGSSKSTSIFVSVTTTTASQQTTISSIGASGVTIISYASATAGPTVTVTAPARSGTPIGGGTSAGIVIGVLAGLALGIGLGWLLLKRRRSQNYVEGDECTSDIGLRDGKDEIARQELHGNSILREADSNIFQEMPLRPSELDGGTPASEAKSPVEMGIRSLPGTVSRPAQIADPQSTPFNVDTYDL